MTISRELIYLMTHGRSSFHRQNLHGSAFTADPFSTTNLNHSGFLSGVHSRGAIALHAAKDKTKVDVTKFISKHRITKKGKKKNRKLLSLSFATKQIDAKKRIATHCGELERRGNRLHQTALRAQKHK